MKLSLVTSPDRCTPDGVQRAYLTIILFSTLSTSFIFGINTLFLLDAGLTNTQAFSVNAAYTVGLMLFEIPTGVVADVRGRRISYLMGVVFLIAGTAGFYWLWAVEGSVLMWLLVSGLTGLGYTFFSGATEAWLVDALSATGFKGQLEDVFAKGQVVTGVAMLSGSVLGGVIAQVTDLGVPYLLRVGFLVLTFVIAANQMIDIGFTPDDTHSGLGRVKHTLRVSLEHGIGNKSVRWMIFAQPFAMGVMVYVFYAMQPLLLERFGDDSAFWIAGLAAAIVSGAQILGGVLAPWIRRFFEFRTVLIGAGITTSAAMLFSVWLIEDFYFTLFAICVWALAGSALRPVRSAYMNGLIPSSQRATVLSFDSLVGSSGGVVTQPALGRVADSSSFGLTIGIAAAIQLVSLPFIRLARQTEADVDRIG